MLLFVPETLYPAGRKLAIPKDSGEVSYPVATDAGAGTWMEAAVEVELRESIFTIKNFTVGFTAPAWEKKKNHRVDNDFFKASSLHKFKLHFMFDLGL